MKIELYGMKSFEDMPYFSLIATLRVKKKIANKWLYEDILVYKKDCFIINFISDDLIKASQSKVINLT